MSALSAKIKEIDLNPPVKSAPISNSESPEHIDLEDVEFPSPPAPQPSPVQSNFQKLMQNRAQFRNPTIQQPEAQEQVSKPAKSAFEYKNCGGLMVKNYS
ncbi:MAG: hypothetical protein QW303_02710 [Nitrososphaerota archaeon]